MDDTDEVRKTGRSEDMRRVTGGADRMNGRRSLLDFRNDMFTTSLL